MKQKDETKFKLNQFFSFTIDNEMKSYKQVFFYATRNTSFYPADVKLYLFSVALLHSVWFTSLIQLSAGVSCHTVTTSVLPAL